MSNKVRRASKTIAFFAAFFAAGIPFWLVPYHQVNLPNALLTGGLIVVPVAALLLRSLGVTRTWSATIIAGTAVPAAVMARVAVECAQDPTAHNLWPLELVIAIFVGFSAAFVGALAGKLIVLFLPAARGA